ncbi:hypothetical protein BKA60DRAFT_546057 [Fusarium oxysporum]|nr:hypothetical protein BKA60DRAFT_546057 [Fusarium oxysporum]
MHASTAVPSLAPSKTIKGLLPPSSRVSFVKLLARCWARRFPTLVDPVKLSLCTSLGLYIASPTSAILSSVVATLMTPTGKTTCYANTACAMALSGVSPAGFQTVVHPAASAAPTLRVIMAMGKFQGARHAATPSGS